MNGKSPFFNFYSQFKPIVLLCIMGFLFLSCSESARRDSFITGLGRIDGYISMGRTEKALSELKKLTDIASSADQWLSIIKRMKKINADSAEILEKAVKKVPGNPRLTAVYTAYLLSHNRPAEAVLAGEKLKDTDMKSLYAEALLSTVKDSEEYFIRTGFPAVFETIWTVTGNPAFLRNAAVIHAVRGDLAFALRLHPADIGYTDEPLFWAVLSYDAGDFMQALEDARLADMRASEMNNGTGSPEALLLAADAAYQMEDFAQAKDIWNECILLSPDYSPLPYYNNALNTENYEEEKKLLTILVNTFPYYVPGLSAYGQLTLDETAPASSDSVAAALKSAGLQTLAMEMENAAAHIPPEDALFRMERALGTYHDPLLILEYNKLKWKVKKVPSERRAVDIWYLLEENPENEYLYEYGVWLFLSSSRIAEAEGLMERWLSEQYGTPRLNLVFENAAASSSAETQKNTANTSAAVPPLEVERLSGWEREYNAILRASDGKHDEAAFLLEHLAGDTERYLRSLINLAHIRSVQGQTKEARGLYGIAAGQTTDKKEKSRIHYRIGCLYAAEGDSLRAKTSISYSLSLDPGNYEARILLKKL